MMKIKTFFNWSTGKDSALALYYLQIDPNFTVQHLITSINSHHNRVSMHGVRRELLEQQVKAINLPFSTLELPEQPEMNDYESIMIKELSRLKMKGFTHSAFGDIFLEDLKNYRVQKLSELELKAVFPLWQKDTSELLHEFIRLGFKAIVVCVNTDFLDESFVGRYLDEDFLRDLPENVDPCGENGEYHTFCFDGPIFDNPIQFNIGEKVYREYKSPVQNKQNTGLWFIDLLSVNQS